MSAKRRGRKRKLEKEVDNLKDIHPASYSQIIDDNTGTNGVDITSYKPDTGAATRPVDHLEEATNVNYKDILIGQALNLIPHCLKKSV